MQYILIISHYFLFFKRVNVLIIFLLTSSLIFLPVYIGIIISDVMMDNGDGFELYKNVFQQKRFKHIPFIFLTAKTEDKLQGLFLGAIDYIFKPFLIAELIEKIESILNNLSEQRSAIIDIIHQSIVSK